MSLYEEYSEHCRLDMGNEHDSPSTHCYGGNVFLLMVTGILVNGPYALITTAVSAELGIHPSLQGKTIAGCYSLPPIINNPKYRNIIVPFFLFTIGSAKALATVTALIDGTGSIGAAVGPFLAGALESGPEAADGKEDLDNVFYMLMASNVVALLVRSIQNYFIYLI